MIFTYFLIFYNFIINVILFEKYLHIYQQKDYNNIRYIRYFKIKTLIFIIINILSLILLNFIKNTIFFITFNIFLLFFNNIFHFFTIKNNKTPIRYTNKIKRLYLISLILLIIFNLLLKSIILSNLFLIILPMLSNLINFYDKIKNKILISKAIKKLKTINPKIIAITGSNGKTSVKNILLKMLSKKYKTQATLLSFNTPLGISKFINENLNPDTEYIILEYGARRRRDVKKLCSLFGADLGIITTISPQHLETFKSIENIYHAKKELSDYLLEKFCVYNADNIYTFRMYEEKSGEKSKISIYTKSVLYANNIKIEGYKTTFDIHIDDTKYKLTTNLLGRHNITNILLATAIAIHEDIEIPEIIDAISTLVPTPHRLEYISGNMNILDDTYNCSLNSARESIWTLMQTKNKKMIVTPGIIECGKESYNINYQLGKMCSEVDYLIIVGQHNRQAILDGYYDTTSKTPILCNSLEEAKNYFTLLFSQDTLLLLNDLPDDYN